MVQECIARHTGWSASSECAILEFQGAQFENWAHIPGPVVSWTASASLAALKKGVGHHPVAVGETLALLATVSEDMSRHFRTMQLGDQKWLWSHRPRHPTMAPETQRRKVMRSSFLPKIRRDVTCASPTTALSCSVPRRSRAQEGFNEETLQDHCSSPSV